MRVIEMGAADKFDGMVSALPHTADIGYAHWKKDKRFNPFRKFSNTL